jgi:hypothetical protein
VPGLSVRLSGNEVQAWLGTVARDLNAIMARIEAAQDFMQANTDAELGNIYTIDASDAAKLRAAISDMDRLRRVYRGTEEVTPAFNFRLTIREIYGTGSTQ